MITRYGRARSEGAAGGEDRHVPPPSPEVRRATRDGRSQSPAEAVRDHQHRRHGADPTGLRRSAPYNAGVRVLVVSAWPPWPRADGARLILHHHLTELAGRHEITLIAGNRPLDEPLPDTVPYGVTLHWSGPRRRGPLGYAARRARSLTTGEPADLFRHETPALLHDYERALGHEAPDVVHLMGAGTARLARAAVNRGIPVVHMPIDAWRLSYGIHEHRPWWRRAIEVGQHRKVMRHEARHLSWCDAVVVVAEGDAAALRPTLPAGRVHVVPNGIDPGPEPRPAVAEPVVGFHGVMCTDPNRRAAQTLARTVLPAIRGAVPDARLKLIGRDPTPDVCRLASDVIEVTGAVPDVRRALESLAVYVCAMERGSGLKNKVLEAMAAGLPVIATPVGLDGIGAGPGIVSVDSVEEVAPAAIRLLADAGERSRLGREGRARVVREFTWRRSALAIEQIWEAALARTPE